MQVQKKVMAYLMLVALFPSLLGTGLLWRAPAQEQGPLSRTVSAAVEKTTLSSSDYTLLAQAVHAEARGESFTGQVAVAAVVLNRIDNPDFPNSIDAVIYQRGAFTAVADGQIDLQPDAEAYRAVDKALQGQDPSGGALYYYNPAKSTNTWIFTRPIKTQIGSHVFTA